MTDHQAGSRAPLRRVLVIALGETEREAERLVRERFPNPAVEWLDRRAYVRNPLATAVRLALRPYDDVVLFAPDLHEPRLMLTSLLAAPPRASRRWLADRQGRLERWSWSAHVLQRGWPVVRHLAASALALLLAGPLLMIALLLLRMETLLQLRGLKPKSVDRVLYLRSQFWFGLKGGGSVGHTAGVIGGLQAAGVQLQVVSSDELYGATAPVTLVPPEHWLDGRLKEAEELAYNLPFLGAALTAARRFRPDAIYQRFTAFNVAGVVLSRLLRVPLVLEFNSSDVWKGRNWGELRLLGLATLGERINLLGADWIVVVSRVLRDELVAAGIPAAKILVNPNAVDPERFRPDLPSGARREALGLNGQTVVGFSGTFGVWHGIPTLAETLPRVAKERPGVQFLLIGDGPLRGLVDGAAKREGLEERLIQPGLVPYADMPELLAACDILLSPHGKQADGREFFGSPTKLYEYMAAGRAIVASEVGQIGDVLTDGETALLVPPDDAVALGDAIVRLVDDRELRARLGAAAREAAVAEHTWRRNAERVLSTLAGGSI